MALLEFKSPWRINELFQGNAPVLFIFSSRNDSRFVFKACIINGSAGLIDRLSFIEVMSWTEQLKVVVGYCFPSAAFSPKCRFHFSLFQCCVRASGEGDVAMFLHFSTGEAPQVITQTPPSLIFMLCLTFLLALVPRMRFTLISVDSHIAVVSISEMMEEKCFLL